jgi:hypothetical protein
MRSKQSRKRKETHPPRRLRLHPHDPPKQEPQFLLEVFVVGSLVVLADEVAPGLEDVAGELDGGVAEALFISFVRIY